ncbi:MAG: plastocyanin/azurin family copper-binding protein [Phaeospirillum sp.]|nr:plastocyanin/azurin family copper-binding protein [Phaeospirillum sp.]
MRRLVLAAFILVTLAGPAVAGESVRVGMDKMLFMPRTLTIKPGTTVEWVNDEKRTSHSVLFEKEGLPESDRLFPGESWKRTFDKSGVYPYRCGPHPEMTGVIEVTK